jgi:hypothetical protein
MKWNAPREKENEMAASSKKRKRSEVK